MNRLVRLVCLLLALALPQANAAENTFPAPANADITQGTAQAKLHALAEHIAYNRITRVEVHYAPAFYSTTVTPASLATLSSGKSAFTIRDLRQSSYREPLIRALRAVTATPASNPVSVSVGITFHNLNDKAVGTINLDMRALQWPGAGGFVDGTQVNFSPGFYEALSGMFFLPFAALPPQGRCQQTATAPRTSPVDAALEAMASRLTKGGPRGNEHISRVDVLYLPSEIRPLEAITPQMLESGYAYKLSLSEDTALFQQLGSILASARAEPGAIPMRNPWGTRWGIIVGSDRDPPAGSLFLDAEGYGPAVVSGALTDKLTCSTELARWLQSRFLPYFR